MSRKRQRNRTYRPLPERYRPVILAGEIFLILFLIWLARPLWTILILAILLAYLVAMPIRWLSRQTRLPRTVITIVLYLLLLIAVLGLPLLAVPFLVTQTQEALRGLPSFIEQVQQLYEQWIVAPPTIEFFNFRFDLTPATQTLQESLQAFGASLEFESLPPPQEWANAAERVIRSATNFLGLATGLATNIVGRLLAWLLALILTLIISFYLVTEGGDIRSLVLTLVPESEQQDFTELLAQTGSVWRAFFRGQVILSMAVGLTSFVALTLIGLPGAALLAVLAGLLEILPNLGPVLAMIPALIVALVQGSTWIALPNWQVMLIVVGIYALIQQLENNVLVPRIHGQSVDLPPVVILIGVLVGTAQGGILGALLAAPILGTLRIWFEYLHRRLIVEAQEPAPVGVPAVATAERQSAEQPPPEVQEPTTPPEAETTEQQYPSSLDPETQS